MTVMCLTLANAAAIIDHHTSLRPTGRAYTRTWHHAAQLSPGDLFRPDPDRDPHTVTEVRRTRDRRNGPDWITLVDQYANPYSYRSNEPVPTAIPDPSSVYQRCICQETNPMITITHTPVDGTVLDGTERGDGINPETPELEVVAEPLGGTYGPPGTRHPAPPSSR